MLRQRLLAFLHVELREHRIRSCAGLHRERDVAVSAIHYATRDFRWGNRTCKGVSHARTRPQTTDETAQDRNAAVPLHRLRRSSPRHLLRSPNARGVELVRLAPEARLCLGATHQKPA
jgi:hypothetical protein